MKMRNNKLFSIFPLIPTYSIIITLIITYKYIINNRKPHFFKALYFIIMSTGVLTYILLNITYRKSGRRAIKGIPKTASQHLHYSKSY